MKKVLKKEKLLNFALLDILLFTIVLYFKYQYFFDSIQHNNLFFSTKAKIHTIITLICMSGLMVFLSSKIRKIGLLFLDILLTLHLYIDNLYFQQFHDVTSFSLLYMVNQVGDIQEAIFQSMQWKDIYYSLDIVIGAILWIALRKYLFSFKEKRSFNQIGITYTLLFILFFSNLGVILAETNGTDKRNSNINFSVFAGVINFHLFDLYDFIYEQVQEPVLTDEIIKEIDDSFSKQDTSMMPYWSQMYGKNIVMVQMESMAGYLIDLKIDGKEVTPNLNQLAKENYYADSMVKQIEDGHTSDAEFVVLNSLYPLRNGSVYVSFSRNDYNALPSILKKYGYTTVAFHGYREDFWNRKNIYPQLGFDHSYFEKDFMKTDNVRLGVSDNDVFKQGIEELENLQEPFFAFFVTLQHHTPFHYVESDFDVGRLKGTKIGQYLQSAHEADKAIGVLMDTLKEKDMLKNTLVILYGDHDAELEEKEMTRLFGHATEVDKVLWNKVPFILITPNHTITGINHQVLGQIDIMPTILHLLGVDMSMYKMYGQVMFFSNPNKAVICTGDWFLTNHYVFKEDVIPNKLVAYDLKTEKRISLTNEMAEIYIRLMQEKVYSDLLIRTNGITLMNSK